MSTKTKATRSVKATTIELREGSNIAKVYNALKDGKPHKLSTIKKMLEKAGVSKRLSLVFRLGRLLRRNTSSTIEINYETDTIQLVSSKHVAKASKPVTKKVSKPVGHTKAAKTHSKASKAVAVAVGAGDDDLMEE